LNAFAGAVSGRSPRLLVPTLIAIWALIGLQRFAPGFMAPFVIKEFGLTNTQWGVVTGVLAFSWAFGALAAGFIADKLGPKLTIVAAGLFSGLLGWSVALVQSLGQLVGARLLLGLAEGALWPAITSALTRIVPPSRRGTTISILIASFLFVGTTVGAPLVTALGQSVGWRWCFLIVSAPLLALTTVVWRRLDARDTVPRTSDDRVSPVRSVLANRNVLLSAAISACFISRLFIIGAFGTLYLTEIHGMSVAAAGAALGPSLFGDVVGTLVFGWLADRTGSRKTLVFSLAAASAVAAATFALLPAGSSVAALMASLFLFTFFAGGVTPLMLVVIPTEATGPTHAAAAVGVANFSGEFFGAGLLPIVGGALGDFMGLRYTILLTAVLALGAAVLSLGLKQGRVADANTPFAVR
jgi:predicted MFS family arabinose efflux permease